MKNLFKIGLCITSLSLVAGAWAKDDHIILQAAAKNHVSVSAIAKLKDETAVTLKGTLLKHLNEDHYEFSDGTGVILLDIDDDLWKASNIKAGDKVQVMGEVDTHRYKPTDIEVVKIEKVSVHDKFHRTLILSGFCLLKIAKISLNSSFFPKPIKR